MFRAYAKTKSCTRRCSRRIRRGRDVPAAILVSELAMALDRDCLERQNPVLASKRFSGATDDLHLRRLTVCADDDQHQNSNDTPFHDQSPFIPKSAVEGDRVSAMRTRAKARDYMLSRNVVAICSRGL